MSKGEQGCGVITGLHFTFWRKGRKDTRRFDGIQSPAPRAVPYFIRTLLSGSSPALRVPFSFCACPNRDEKEMPAGRPRARGSASCRAKWSWHGVCFPTGTSGLGGRCLWNFRLATVRTLPNGACPAQCSRKTGLGTLELGAAGVTWSPLLF